MFSSKLVGCWYKKNQSAALYDNDVIMSDWVWPIGLCHLEFRARNLDFGDQFWILIKIVSNKLLIYFLLIVSEEVVKFRYGVD